MNPKLKRTLEFLRLIDTHDGLVSLTNVALLVVLVKLAIAPAVGLTEIGGLLIALASYQGKKVINKDAGQDDGFNERIEALQASVEETSGRVSDLALKAGIRSK